MAALPQQEGPARRLGEVPSSPAREGIPAETLLQAAKNYAAECYRKGTAREFILHGATFFGPKRRWEDYLDPESEEAPPDVAKARKCHQRGGCRSTWAEAKGNPTCRWCSINLRGMTPPEEKAV